MLRYLEDDAIERPWSYRLQLRLVMVVPSHPKTMMTSHRTLFLKRDGRSDLPRSEGELQGRC